MKNLPSSPFIPIMLLVFTVFVSCSKQSGNEREVQSVSLTKSFPEINLSVNLIFQTQQVDQTEVTTSNNFEIESINSTYNEEQKREYISLKCRKKVGKAEAYFVYIVRESDGTIVVSYSSSNN